jgi:hypothetical protein
MLNRLLIEILKEVGEGTAQPYTLTRVSDELMRFTTKDGDDYAIELEFLPNKPNTVLLAFRTGIGYGEYEQLTNRSDIYRIMATMIAAVKLQLEAFPNTDTIVISPSKADASDNRRLYLYLAYIRGQIKPGSGLDNWTVSIEENTYTMEADIVLKRNK